MVDIIIVSWPTARYSTLLIVRIGPAVIAGRLLIVLVRGALSRTLTVRSAGIWYTKLSSWRSKGTNRHMAGGIGHEGCVRIAIYCSMIDTHDSTLRVEKGVWARIRGTLDHILTEHH